MFVKSFASFALLTSLVVPYASAAIVSLYFPQDNGGLPTPLTADPIGTDKSGHTTWRFGVGASSGTFTAIQSTASPSATLVEGATDFHALGADGSASIRVDCALASPTASGAVVVASCAGQFADESSTLELDVPPVTLTPIPVQVSDKFKSSDAGSLRMSLGGVVVSVLTVVGAAGMMLVRV